MGLKLKECPLEQHLKERDRKAPRGMSDILRELNREFKKRGLPIEEESEDNQA